MFDLIKRLTEIPGMVGQEDEVQQAMRELWEPHAESVYTTAVGNLIAHIGGSGPKLAIVSHADEIGVYVKSISPEGLIWLAPRWGLPARPGRDVHYLGQKCIIQTQKGHVEGFFAMMSGHVTPPAMREKGVIDWGDLWVEVGAKSAAEVAEMGIQIGDGIVWSPETRRVGHYIVGKAMDDRAALALMTDLLHKINKADLKFDLYFASTVQEETGSIGAYSLETDIKPDLAVSLDIGLAGDTPGVDTKEITTKLGAGPILVHHSTIHYDRRIIRHMADLAAGLKMPVQHAIYTRYGSDSDSLIQMGVPSALLTFATRYTHSPYEMIEESDVLQCVELLKAFVTTKLPFVIGRRGR